MTELRKTLGLYWISIQLAVIEVWNQIKTVFRKLGGRQ